MIQNTHRNTVAEVSELQQLLEAARLRLQHAVLLARRPRTAGSRKLCTPT